MSQRVPSIPLLDPPSPGILRRVERESVEGRIHQLDEEHWEFQSSDGKRRYTVRLVLGWRGEQLVIRLNCTCQASYATWCYHRVHIAARVGLLDLERLAVAS